MRAHVLSVYVFGAEGLCFVRVGCCVLCTQCVHARTVWLMCSLCGVLYVCVDGYVRGLLCACIVCY